jgi:hypothetical protein
LISPQLPAHRAYSSERGMEFILDFEWNDGILEEWVSKTDDGLNLNSDPCHLYKKRSNSAKPSIPLLHHSRAYVHGTANFF